MKLLCVLEVSYALSPIDLIPYFIPVLGLLDDVTLLLAAIWLICRMIPEDVYRENPKDAPINLLRVGGKLKTHSANSFIC